MRTARFEVYEAKDGWRWRLRAKNGRIVCTGEAHPRKRDARRALIRVADMVVQATIEEMRAKGLMA